MTIVMIGIHLMIVVNIVMMRNITIFILPHIISNNNSNNRS
jgi:hypothetical protein